MTTRQPTFTEADAQGAPTLRPGVWASASPDCDYDPNKSISAWPDCVQASVVRRSEIAELGQPFDTYVLASGYPRILQLSVMVRPQDADAYPIYLYDAVVASRFDQQGRIMSARRWTIGCPPAADDTAQDYPCLPAEPEALRRAAKDDTRARAWIWLRDGES